MKAVWRDTVSVKFCFLILASVSPGIELQGSWRERKLNSYYDKKSTKESFKEKDSAVLSKKGKQDSSEFSENFMTKLIILKQKFFICFKRGPYVYDQRLIQEKF